MTSNVRSVSVLVFHGSRDPRSQQAAAALTQQVQQHIQHTPALPAALGQDLGWRSTPPAETVTTNLTTTEPPLAIADAYLECHPLPLDQQLVQLVHQVRATQPASDVSLRVQVIPVLLLAGVHVREDIPAAVAIAQTQLPPTIQWEITTHFGSCPGLHRIVMERLSGTPMEAWILLAHGSQRPGANQAIETLAERVGAIAAYWATAPNLETQLQALQTAGLRRIGILPYFLFSGGITDAIAQTVATLTQHHPNLSLSLAETLDHNAGIADVLVELIQRASDRTP